MREHAEIQTLDRPFPSPVNTPTTLGLFHTKLAAGLLRS